MDRQRLVEVKVKPKFVVHEDDEDQNNVQSEPEEVSDQLEEDFDDDGTESGSDIEGRSKKKAKVSKEGARALAKNLVLYTRSTKSNKQLNVNCRVDQFARIIEELDEQRLRVVEEMGFRSVLVGGDGREFPLYPVQVQCIVGIPRGKQVVPIEIDPNNVDNLMRFNDILEWFGKDQCGKGFISTPEAKQEVLREGQLVDVVKFKVAFLVVVLGMMLCTTTNFSTLASDVVPALCAADQPHDYDWCTYVLQFLMRRARSFSKNLHKDGFVVGCGGCTFFLSILYVDHLKRPPMCWGEFPRIKAWSKESFSKVAKDDMRTSGDYDKTKTVDVAYGEAHPRAPRDVYPKESLGMAEEVSQVANRIREVLSKEMRELKGVVELVLQGRREESSAVRTLGRGTMIAPSTATTRATSSNIGRPPSFSFVPTCQPIFETTSVGLSSSTPLPSVAATAPTSSSSQAAFANVPSTSTQDANESVRDDPVLIMCNGVNVTQSSCYGALLPLGTVDASFVKMAGVMFNIEWAKKYKDTDYNTFTKGKVAREAWLKEFATEATYDGASLTMVFVPFVLQQHWTCICFALKDNRIWVIDSIKSCGIHMLMCMDECVDTILEKFVLESIDEVREALVLCLLLSDLNEMKDQLGTIVKG
ncbi:50S ribosomal protein L21 [Bienertia sinuspersici]